MTGAFGKKWFPETMGAGCGFFDYDRDDWPDIVLVRGGTWADNDTTPVLALYQNSGAGHFVEVTEKVGLSEARGYGLGVTIGDYDNDGDDDIFLTTVGRNQLFQNNGGRFSEVSQAAGLAGDEVWSTSAIFFDADKDGWLDLYVGNYVEWSPETDIWCSLDGKTKSYCTPELYTGINSRFYHNNSDGTFSDWTARAGFAGGPGKTLGVAEFDFNRDGWPDLTVANDTQRNELYVNNGDGTFTEKGILSGIAYDENGRARAGMGIDVGVVDNTGEESVFVGNFAKEMIGVYRHAGDGIFVDRAAASKIGRVSLLTLTFGLMLLDIDLDGDLDLFAANGHVVHEIERTQDGVKFRQPPHLFLNDGKGNFWDAAPEIGGVLAAPLVARGAACTDYDRDGDLDILVTENGGPVHLWRNESAGAGKHYLRVTVEGNTSNRNGYGVQLIATVGEMRMYRRIRSGSSFLSHSEAAATFGLGAAAEVDTLVVQWPAGKVERLTSIKADREIKLFEAAEKKLANN
ncbi:CRTAC1 family protein [candidate division KSB1 bacterium]|nr:CRTAC1 family protein [candidate division KSB1 bacterium]